MKILIINTYYYPEIVGGAEYSVKKLAEALKRSGNEVVVLCTGDENIRETVDGVDVIRIRANVPCRAINLGSASTYQKIICRIRGIWNRGNSKRIDEVLNVVKPDVIHTNGLYDLSPVVWKVAKKHNIRVVHTLRDYYLCCPLVSLDCESRVVKCRFKNNLCPIHRSANIDAVEKYVDALTAPSIVTLNKVVATMNLQNIPRQVIPNAIDFDLLEVKRNCEIKQARNSSVLKFVYLGTLSEKKGVLWLLDSFSKITSKDAELYIAGKGELEKAVIEYSSKDSRIHFVGFLKEAEMNRFLEKMDVLVCPSLWEEPFGRVVLDAYKHAMPVIVSDKGALPELVTKYGTGQVVKSDSKETLIDAISSCCRDKEKISQMSRRTLNAIRDFSLDAQLAQFLSLYKNN